MTADFRSECKLSELMMEMPCGFALFQSTGEVSYSNSRAREILGVLPGENHGGSLTTIIVRSSISPDLSCRRGRTHSPSL